MMGHVKLGAVALMAACPPAVAHAETLADAIALAYRSNPTIGVARYEVRALDEDHVQARAELRPQVSFQATASYDRAILGSANLTPFAQHITDTNAANAQIVIDQPLTNGGRSAADIDATKAAVRAGREQLRGAEGDLLLSVVSAYVDIRRDEEVLRIRRSFHAALSRQVDEIRARRTAGELTLTDVAQGETQLDAAQSQIDMAEEQLQASRSNYTQIVGSNPGVLAPEPPLPNLPASIDEAFDHAETLNPELRGSRFTEDQSREQIAAARAAGNPTISLRGVAGLSGPATTYDLRRHNRDLTGQIVLSQPLFQGGRVRSQIRQAQDRNDADRLRVEAARRTMVQQIAGDWNAIVRTRRNLVTQQALVKAAATAFDGMFAEYRAGLRSTFDLLYAEQNVRDAEIGTRSLEHDLYVGQASLLRHTGLLEAANLLQSATLYDASANLKTVEHRGALPWDIVPVHLDRLLKPRARPAAVGGPAATANARAVSASPPAIVDRMIEQVPTVPIPGMAVPSNAAPRRD